MTGDDKRLMAREDAELGFLLKRHDPIAPLNARELAAIERGVWSRIDALTTPASFMPTGLPAWLAAPDWALRGGAMAAILVTLLGFAAGRHFTETAAAPADQEMMFASAGGMPWHSFLTEPQSGDTGDIDDSGE